MNGALRIDIDVSAEFPREPALIRCRYRSQFRRTAVLYWKSYIHLWYRPGYWEIHAITL